ncbi:acyl-CoA dehydrogenase [Ferrimonas pelagia]|uniref:Acyl-CoA dehydrogenase family protein n=1 Tax=Ferrimonas pelagia TaxID=1177826 RepID=A0ABP9ERE4_9GAMM
MSLAFNEEQRALKDTARDFAQAQAPVEALRALRDAGSATAFDDATWQQLLELGWGGMLLPESYGGFDFGLKGLCAGMEEFGRTLVCSPLLSSVVLSGSAILAAGNEQQKLQWLPQIAAGELRFALALDEGVHHNPANIQTSAIRTADGFELSGCKQMVIDGIGADKLLVAALEASELGLYIVDPSATGVTLSRRQLADSRNYAQITLDKVAVAEQHKLSGSEDVAAALELALDNGRLALAAEQFGGIQAMFERTVEYLKERKQFGVHIGSFQALQHRAAKMYIEIQQSKTVLMDALSAVEADRPDRAARISAAKAKIGEIAELVTNEATQLHGGIGVTDELEVGFFLKRARVAQVLLGNSQYHYDRFARLSGY